MSTYKSDVIVIDNSGKTTTFRKASTIDIFDKFREWGESKGITGPNGKGTVKAQIEKLEEEFDELKEAIESGDIDGIKDAIGDMANVQTHIATMYDMTIEDCLQTAYDEVSKRKGKMVDGTFVKEAK